MKWPIHRKIGIFLLIVAVVPLVFIEYYMRYGHNWVPLDMPIVLKPGELRSPQFKTDINGRYLASLAADELRGPVADKEQCMMGFTFAPNILYCDGVGQTADFDWQIISDRGTVLASGRYKPNSFSGAQMGFAEFQGHRGIRQRIILTVRRDGGDLNSYHPRIIVEAGPEDLEKLTYWHFYSWIWAEVVGALGIVVILGPIGYGAAKSVLRRSRRHV